MRKEIPNFILKAHNNARSKGYWDNVDLYFYDQALMLVIYEISEALEAIRKNRYSDINAFNQAINKDGLVNAYNNHIKGSFEEEMADVCIRIFDFIGGMDIKISIVQSFYEKEKETWAGKTIESIPSLLLTMTKGIVDVKYNTWKAQYLGEVLGQIDHIMKQLGHDLAKHIELKMNYNSIKPKDTLKSF